MTESEYLFMGLYYLGRAGFDPNKVKMGEGSTSHLKADHETCHKAYQILSRKGDMTLNAAATAFLGRPTKQALVLTMWLLDKVEPTEYVASILDWNNKNPREVDDGEG